MTRENYLRPIRERILSSETGTLFITSDFLDIADTDPINKSLSTYGGKRHPAYSPWCLRISGIQRFSKGICCAVTFL